MSPSAQIADRLAGVKDSDIANVKTAQTNPNTNQLSTGIQPAQVLSAVDQSGYPLQIVVGDLLRERFVVLDEWSYLDRDSKELRTIDLRADRRLHGWDPQPRVRPQLTLIIECKQSQLPYVFFLTKTGLRPLSHPSICGLHSPYVTISTDDDLSTWHFTAIHALGLEEDPFQTAPPYCHTLSKCVRKGSELELSGTEAYNGLMLPLIKGLEHLATDEAPPPTAWYFDAHLSIGLGVVNAPMVAASVESGATELTLLPWVRVLRHEYDDEAPRTEKNRVAVINVVHKDFLSEYLDNHLLPFAERFSERVLRHPTELATGRAFAAGMGANCWGEVETRLRPTRVSEKPKRWRMIVGNVVRLLTTRSSKEP